MWNRLFTLSLMTALLAPAFALEWTEDFAAAKRRAKAEKKLVLMDFTGSDWCRNCMRLRGQVLDTPEFEAYAEDKFVFMEVDCPRTKKLPDKLTKQNQELCNTYHISGFPTLLVVTPKGEVVGGVGGFKNREEVQASLDKAIKADAAIRAAKKLPTDKQQTALNRVYQGMESAVRKAGGYKAEGAGNVAQQREELDAKLKACKNPAQMKKVLAKAEPALLPGNRQFFLQRRYTVLLKAAETEEDLAAVRTVGEELADGMPAPNAEQFRAQMDKDFADPAAYLKRRKEAKKR